MPPNYIYPNRNQGFLLPPSIRDWLPESDYVWFIIETIESMNLSTFNDVVRQDGKGGAWYEPKMMATLLVYAYSLGVRSSRKIEQLCERDIAFRIICGNLKPDHSSIARFRQIHEGRFKVLFAKVLELCREAKLTKAGVIALDGTKLAGNASLAANRTEDLLRAEVEKIVKEAAVKDAEEDQQFGEKRGDELPKDLRRSEDRKRRIKECLRQIEERKAAEQTKRDELLRRRTEKEAAGQKVRGRKPKEPPETKEPKVNVTDPESRIMKNGKGYLQGYNAQAVANDRQIIIAAEVTQDQNDQGQLRPMIGCAIENLEKAGETKLPKVALADAGYPSENALAQPFPGNIEVIVATKREKLQRTTNLPAPKGRIPKNATAMERMGRKTRTKRGKALYKRRGQIIEPVFGQIKSGLQGVNRFSRRGKDACDSEWKLICAVYNLRKLWTYTAKRAETGKAIN
jgi:transposase